VRDAEPKTIPRARALRKRLTDAERILWSRLRCHHAGGLHFRKQHPLGPYIADFVCLKARLVVEVDGVTHSTAEEIAHDRRRDAFLESRGWRILRVQNDDVYKDLYRVLDAIGHAICDEPPGGK
jgi:very-short-patch-repair endonuclease